MINWVGNKKVDFQIINNQITMMKSGIELTYNLAGLNVDNYVSGLLDTFIDDYSWTSLDATQG